MNWIKIMITTLLVWNAIVFITYGIDKRKAKRGKQRISEATLLFMAFLMGGIGALLGMRAFKHKTKHIKFKIGVPILLVINIAVFIACVIFF